MENLNQNPELKAIEAVKKVLKISPGEDGLLKIQTKLGEESILPESIDFIAKKVASLSDSSSAFIEKAGPGHNIKVGKNIKLSSFSASSPDIIDPDNIRVSKTIFQGVVDTLRAEYNIFT